MRKKGLAYCRVDLYNYQKKARTLCTSDLLTHSKDIDTVVGKLRQMGYKNIFAVGHSFGGLVLLRTNQKHFKAYSFWDISSFIEHPPKFWIKTQKKTGIKYLTGSYELLLSPRFEQGLLNFPDELELASKIKIPTQICYASGPKDVLVESSKRYFEHLNCDAELVGFPEVSHSFTEEGVDNQLYKYTYRWFKKCKN